MCVCVCACTHIFVLFFSLLGQGNQKLNLCIINELLSVLGQICMCMDISVFCFVFLTKRSPCCNSVQRLTLYYHALPSWAWALARHSHTTCNSKAAASKVLKHTHLTSLLAVVFFSVCWVVVGVSVVHQTDMVAGALMCGCDLFCMCMVGEVEGGGGHIGL